MTRPRIAIIGAGPSGCYSAQAVLKQMPDADVCIFDALPVPFGLIRHGVAADHQGTKAVTKQFARLFEKNGVQFFGGVTIGEDIELAAIRACFDAVVIAHGLHGDIGLDVPGADLPGVFGAGRITRLLNGHPLETRPAPSLGAAVAIVGMGNVALDLVRLLAKSGNDLVGSDIDDEIHAQLTSEVRTIHIIGRSQPVDARFDPAMARELIELPTVEHAVHGVDIGQDGDPRSSIISELDRAPHPPSARVRVEWWFGYAPSDMRGDRQVTGIDIERVDSDDVLTIPVDTVITAIGFTATAQQRLAADTTEAGDTGRLSPGLYVAGWARRGPRGTIPSHRSDAQQLASLIATDLKGPFTRAGAQDLEDRLASAYSYDGWLRVDALETSQATSGRVRKKLTDINHMRAIAAGHSLPSKAPGTTP